jgi:hypothetical protein
LEQEYIPSSEESFPSLNTFLRSSLPNTRY